MTETWHFRCKENRDKFYKKLLGTLPVTGKIYRRSNNSVMSQNYVEDAIIESNGTFHRDIDRGLGNLNCCARYHIDWVK